MGGLSGPERTFLLGLLAFTLFGSCVHWFAAKHPERFSAPGEESASPGVPSGPAVSLAGELREIAGPLTLLEMQRRRVEEAIRQEGNSSPVDVNRASAAELESLPGVGPAIARRIVEDRERLGTYRTLEDLARVKGIGPRILARLRPCAVAGPVQNAIASGDST